MATKKKTKTKKAGSATARTRIDRRFLPQTTTSPKVLYACLILGGLLTGAGAYAQMGRQQLDLEPLPYGFALIALGLVLAAVASWFSTSGDAAVRVGDPGVAVERGGAGLRRIPWYGLDSVHLLEGDKLEVVGKDEAGESFSFALSTRTHRAAAAQLLSEAKQRVPAALKVSDEETARIGAPDPSSATSIREPLQVVGKRCQASQKIVAYEPDARVCEQCERIYHKREVPKTCACGADLEELRDAVPQPLDPDVADALASS